MYKFTDAYVAQDVESAAPARLIELLYQRALRDLREARELWPTDQSGAAVHQIVHAQAILRELTLALNYADGGKLAVELGRLYEYMQFRLTEAVTHKAEDAPHNIGEVAELLFSLSDAWSTMMLQPTEAENSNVLLSGGNLVA